MKNKTRCTFCNKKTGLINYSCECGGIFCQIHRYTHTHNCKCIIDKKEKTKEIIKKDNPKMKSSTLEKV